MSRPPRTELPAYEKRLGHYAGFATRAVALAVDVGILWGLFTLAAAGVSLFIELVSGVRIQPTHDRTVWDASVAIWGFLYFAIQWTLSARTAGMAFMGLQVVRRDGARIGAKAAWLRTLGLVICTIFVIPAVIVYFASKERRCIDDMMAGTAVVYSWDARAARLRRLAHRDPLAEARAEVRTEDQPQTAR